MLARLEPASSIRRLVDLSTDIDIRSLNKFEGTKMRSAIWPESYRIEPDISKESVITAINAVQWHPEEWKALQVAANLNDKRAETPKAYGAFLKRSKADFWTPASVHFWKLIIVSQQFYQAHQLGPGSF